MKKRNFYQDGCYRGAGIYIPDFGGVRIEDLVVITKDGIDNLTKSPKELIEILN